MLEKTGAVSDIVACWTRTRMERVYMCILKTLSCRSYDRAVVNSCAIYCFSLYVQIIGYNRHSILHWRELELHDRHTKHKYPTGAKQTSKKR